jgi:hypothetical protein
MQADGWLPENLNLLIVGDDYRLVGFSLILQWVRLVLQDLMFDEFASERSKSSQ